MTYDPPPFWHVWQLQWRNNRKERVRAVSAVQAVLTVAHRRRRIGPFLVKPLYGGHAREVKVMTCNSKKCAY